MTIRLAIVGLETIQQDWLIALRALATAGEIDLVAIAHRHVGLSREVAEALAVPTPIPPYDDLRKMMVERSPQAILLDRPDYVGLDFLTSCIDQNIGLFSLGPPVIGVAEALRLADHLEPRTALLYIWPRLAATRSYRHCAQADEFVKPVRFASARWYAFNHALARTSGRENDAVRSLSVLAWDALGTLIDLVGGGAPPETVYAALRGTVGKTDNFADLSGAAALTLRFPETCVASLSISDRLGPWQREIRLLGQSGSLHLDEQQYHFADSEGKLIDEGRTPPAAGPERAADELREFIAQFVAQPSPHRGWEHRLEAVASCLEAMMVSHRTGQPEAPERFLNLRR